MLVMTRNIPCSTSSSSIFIKGLMHSLQHLWVASHAEIIIGTPHGDPLTLVCHVGLRKLLCETIDVIEIAIRFVLMLLLDFRIVETIVVEFGSIVAGNGNGSRFGLGINFTQNVNLFASTTANQESGYSYAFHQMEPPQSLPRPGEKYAISLFLYSPSRKRLSKPPHFPHPYNET